MLSRILRIILVCSMIGLIFSSLGNQRSLAATGDDYHVYSKFNAPGTGLVWAAGGYVEYYGVPEWGDEIQYVYFLQREGSRTIAYKVKVWVTNEGSAADPTPYIDIRQHPDHPTHTGPIEPRHFEIVSSFDITEYADTGDWASDEFYVDSTGVYLGAWPYGINKWDHDWNYIGQIAPVSPPSYMTQTLAYDPARNVWYAGGAWRDILQLSDINGDGDFMDETWQYIFTTPDYAGSHHDGMEYVGGYLWISDMTSDVIAKWQYDDSTDTWAEIGRYSYTEAAAVEGMGFGPNDHFWIGGYDSAYIYELGNEITKGYPIANAGPDVEAHPPTIPITVDGSGSHHTDPAKQIVLYEWDFEGDGIWDYTGTNPIVEHTYPAYYKPDGSIDWDNTVKDYPATLRVTDNSDPPLQDTDTCIVHITAPPWKPVADPGGPYEGVNGVPIQLDGSQSYDPESKMVAPGHPWYETIAKYEWDLDYDGEFDDSTDVQPSWTWESEGIYIVSLRVTDSQPSGPGGTVGPLDVDVKHTTVVITKQPPPNTKIETHEIDSVNGTAKFTWSGSDDKTPPAQLVYKHRLLNPDSPLYDWTDWSSSTTATYPRAPDSRLPDGTYRFQVKAKDADGAIQPDSATWEFTIGGVPAEFWVQVYNTGSTLAIRKTPGTRNKPADDVLKRVPDGWVLRVLSTVDESGNTVVKDGFTWWKVEESEYESQPNTGWVAKKYLKGVSFVSTPPSSPGGLTKAAWEAVADEAVQWATHEDRIGSNEWKGLCAKFVANAFGQAAAGYNADDLAEYLRGKGLLYPNPEKGIYGNPPRGALIFFKPAKINDWYGHVAIYLGNGEMVNQYVDIRVMALKDYSTSVGYKGWAYPPEEWLPNQAAAPTLIQDFNASDGEGSQSTLTWTNPSDNDLDRVVVQRKTAGYPTSHTAGDTRITIASATPGRKETFIDEGLTNGQTYYYAVFSKDSAGNWNDKVQEGKNSDTGTPRIIPEWRRDIRLGDILLHRARGGLACVLTWTHAGIYLGNDLVAEARGEKDGGINVYPIEDWDYPHDKMVTLRRVTTATEDQRMEAANWAEKQTQRDPKPQYSLHWLSKKPDPDSGSWYCSELVWAAYFNQGINIDYDDSELSEGVYYPHQPVAPDDIYSDSDTGKINSHQEEYPGCDPAAMIVKTNSPVDLVVIDPDGFTISKELGEIPESLYMEYDLDQDGSPEDFIVIPKRKVGNYSITVIPEPGALPTDTYGLEIITKGETIVLAEDVPVSEIPEEPYVLTDTPTGTNVQVGFPDQGVTLTFDEVTSAGNTTLTVTDKPPFGTFPEIHFLNKFYQFETTTTFTGNITIKIYHDDTGLTSNQEAALELFKVSKDTKAYITDITTDLDTKNNVITGKTDSFSYFGIGYRRGVIPAGAVINHGPNPVPDTGTAFFYTLPAGTTTAKLMIFNVAGRLLFETPLDVDSARFPSAGTWNPVDQDGVPLANGPYVYVLIADGKVIGQGKMVIQRWG